MQQQQQQQQLRQRQQQQRVLDEEEVQPFLQQAGSAAICQEVGQETVKGSGSAACLCVKCATPQHFVICDRGRAGSRENVVNYEFIREHNCETSVTG